MKYQTSDYFGDAIYSIKTSDCVVGDEIAFDRAIFGGTFRKPTFEGFERIEAKIIRESYSEAGQHTFTLELKNGTTTRIKGRNLYGNSVYRKPWDDEKKRDAIADEKHTRGDLVRERKRAIREEKQKELDVLFNRKESQNAFLRANAEVKLEKNNEPKEDLKNNKGLKL